MLSIDELTPVSASARAVAKESFNFWKGTGLPYVSAIGAVADEQGESSFRVPAQVGDDGTAFGPFQHHMARILAIKMGTGIDMRTATHIEQLQGAYWEMTKGTYRRVWPKLTAAKTLEDAVAVFVVDYEESASQQSDITKRLGFAEYWATQFPQQ